MKSSKILKRIGKIEALMSKLTERSSVTAPDIQELLRDAKAAITRAKKVVSLQASSGLARNPPAKPSQPTSIATPEPSKPKRKLSVAGRKAISEATKKRWAAKRSAAKKLAPAVAKKKALKKVAAKKTTPMKAAPAREVAKAPAKKAPVRAAKAPTQRVAKKAPVKKVAVKAPAKAVRVVQVAKTPGPPTTEVTTVTTPNRLRWKRPSVAPNRIADWLVQKSVCRESAAWPRCRSRKRPSAWLSPASASRPPTRRRRFVLLE